MEPLQLQQQPMNSLSLFPNPLRISLSRYSHHLTRSRATAFFSASSSSSRNGAVSAAVRATTKLADAQLLKDNWLASLSCPFPQTTQTLGNHDSTPARPNSGDSGWVIGVDPDVSGALALLKGGDDDSPSSAQVYDSPHVKLLVGKRVRRRLDAKSIVQLLGSFGAPLGTTAYIEQSAPFPQDGKQGWWSGGFGYGLWIGILVAMGFSVVPVSSLSWKNKFELTGSTSTKDDSRRVASTLFPALSSELERKKDHGRAEALLIAAYGKELKIKTDLSCNPEVLVP